jgi:subtilisin family serine protease
MFSGAGYSYPPGWPAGGIGLTSNNNGKIIASRVYFRSWDPPASGDENPWPGQLGTPHGNHTSGIAAGNIVTATYRGLTVPSISGVAPRAWIMSYRVFYTSATGRGSFYTAEGIAALEDIVADGADVLNNSWGGGPGSTGGEFDALDTALINTTRAGVFVSMSAGNAGPGLGTGDHPSPDYINVAASTTSGTLAAGGVSVTAPTPISPTLQNIAFGTAQFGPPLPIGQVFTYNFKTAASVNPGNVTGCAEWPAGTFTGVAAVIRRGGCDFSLKVYYAQQAGAAFAVIYNQSSNGNNIITMGAGTNAISVTISSLLVGNTPGEGLVTWYATYGAASELAASTVAFQAGNTPDLIANFSSRGPGVGNVLLPDIAAPGVNILSQGYAEGVTGEARHLGFGQASGTSMAAPHVSGAAVLLTQLHPNWSPAYIKSALMSTSKYMDIYTESGAPAQPLDMGAGRLDLTHASDPGVILDPPSITVGQVPTGTTQTVTFTVTSVAAATETYNLSTLYTGGGFTATTSLPGFGVSPASLTLAAGASAVVTVTFDPATSRGIGDNQGYIILDGSTHDAHLPAWARVVAAAPVKDVLLIDADGSALGIGFPNYRTYYTDVLDALGLTYDAVDVAAASPTTGVQAATIPDAANLAGYTYIVIFTGDNYLPSTFFASGLIGLTAKDMDRLTEYANSGGTIIAMGQDMASEMGGTSSSPPFFYASVLGGNYLQDSVTSNITPTLPIVGHSDAPVSFRNVTVDVSDSGDGAGNQFYIDEISAKPSVNPDFPIEELPYQPLFRYPGPYNEQQGVTAMSHRDQPTLERPGISYLGRTIYTTFGLEGVNDTTDSITRTALINLFLDWAKDQPTVTISETTPPNASNLTEFTAAFASPVTGTTAVSYRWDFGDGTAYAGPYASNQVSHTYAVCNTYTVRVEVVDSLGNRAIGASTVPASQCTTHIFYMPTIYR